MNWLPLIQWIGVVIVSIILGSIFVSAIVMSVMDPLIPTPMKVVVGLLFLGIALILVPVIFLTP